MNPNRTVRRWALAAVAGVALGGALVACGDDEKADPTTTTVAETAAQFVERAKSTCGEFQPGFDEFFSEHPTPTAADWAEFLPTQIDGFGTFDQCIKDSAPPTELQDEVVAVTAAMDVVLADLQTALDAAEAGDLDGVDQWITQMHDVDQPKIDEAFGAVMAQVSA